MKYEPPEFFEMFIVYSFSFCKSKINFLSDNLLLRLNPVYFWSLPRFIRIRHKIVFTANLLQSPKFMSNISNVVPQKGRIMMFALG